MVNWMVISLGRAKIRGHTNTESGLEYRDLPENTGLGLKYKDLPLQFFVTKNRGHKKNRRELVPGLKFEPPLARCFDCVEAVGLLMAKRGVSSCNQTNQCRDTGSGLKYKDLPLQFLVRRKLDQVIIFKGLIFET
jgi:hypothetical protein